MAEVVLTRFLLFFVVVVFVAIELYGIFVHPKPGMLAQHEQTECYLESFGCCLQGRGHSEVQIFKNL